MPTAPTTYFKQGLIPRFARRDPVRLPVRLIASITYPKGTVLGEQIGASQVNTVTLGTQSSGTFTLTVNGQTTAGIAYNATAATVLAALELLSTVAANAVQTVTLTSATGGTFTLGYYGQATVPIAYNASAATVATALANLPNVGGSANVAVTGSAGGPWTITFQGTLAGVNVPLLGIGTTLLTPLGTATGATAIVNEGGTSGVNVSVTGSAGGPYTVSFLADLGNQAVTFTGTFTALTTPGNASITSVTAGAAGTPGTYAAYVATNTDGSQVPKCLLEFDCTTDSAGNITPGLQAGGGEFQQTYTHTQAFFSGEFNTMDLVGLDQNAVTPSVSGWRIISGAIGSALGGILALPV